MIPSDDCAVQLLTDMLRTPSLCGQEDRLADLLLQAMRELGFEAHRDEVGNVIGTVSPSSGEGTHEGMPLHGRATDGSLQDETGSESVVILGHMDTVPGSIPVERRDGKLYGRGAVDAKGPLATAIVAGARAAGQAGRPITVIGAVQEEGPSVGARHLRRRVAPAYLIIAEPSGWDAVVLGYKGSQRFTVRITCPGGHTAGPHPTAAERAVGFWNELAGWCRRQSPEGAGPESFNSITPTLIGMNSGSDGLSDTAALHVGLRLPPGVSCRQVQDGMQALCPDGVFDFSPGEEAVRAAKSTPLVARFLRSIRSEGGEPRFKVKTGTSDMNVVGPVWGCPMLAYGPGDSRLDHTPHEHVPLEEYLRAIRILTSVLKEL